MAQAELKDQPKGKAGSAASWAIFGAAVFALAYWLMSAGPTTCEALKNDVLPISKENANAIQPRIIEIVEIKTVSNADGEMRCTGLAILSNAMKQNVTFERTKEYDQWWVKYEGQGLPFN
ncbi:MAG: hypothetical protein V7774_08865 [Pseudorhizobium pelagicum]|uniref:hypothetical protein n=1 Tax=Pseudorhizobium pelagicum TaxID=1509405 RepID=UPI0034606BCA